MENEESERPDPQTKIRRLREHNEYLRGRLEWAQAAVKGLRLQATQWKVVAEENRQSYGRAVSEANRLQKDNVRLAEENGHTPLHWELNEVRAENQRLHRIMSRRRALTRKAVEEMAAARQESRDQDEVIAQLNERLAELEKQRAEAVERAEQIVIRRDRQNARFRRWCERWYRGEVGAIQVIAGIAAELGGNPMAEPSVFERRQAVKLAEALSEIDEWKGYEAAARGAVVRLARHYGASNELVARLVTGDYQDVLEELEKGSD